MRMQTIALFVALALAAGCSRQRAPVTSHGQPVSHWLEALKGPDARTRKKAVTALGHVGDADPAAIPALTEALKDRDPSVRDTAVLALLNIGPAAKPAVPALTEVQNDRDPTVRDHAGKAIERIASRH
jgi:HEAT repeat protein